MAESKPLPPTGTLARKEEVAKRKDATEEALDQANSAPGQGLIDLDQVKIDNEIARAVNRLGEIWVSDAQKGRHYFWASNLGHGRLISSAAVVGWQLVKGDMPEAAEHKDESGHRRVGDAVLMWMSEERYQALMRWKEKRNREQQEGVVSRFEDSAESFKRRGGKVHVLGRDPATDSRLFRKAKQAQRKAEVAQRKANALIRRLDGDCRKGTIPGMEVPQ